MATGSCQCGAITYALSGEALFVYACHCHSCQKRTGSAFSMGLLHRWMPWMCRAN